MPIGPLEEVEEAIKEIEEEADEMILEAVEDKSASKEDLEAAVKITEVMVEKLQQVRMVCKKRLEKGDYGNGRNR